MARQLDNRPTQARLRPEGRGNEVRVDPEPAPPCGFITAAVDLAMVNSAERHRELIAHFAAERPRLRRAKMMGIRGLTAANEAGLRGNELTMVFVADAPRFADRKHAFVDAATDLLPGLSGLAGVHSRIVGVLTRNRCRDMGQCLRRQPPGASELRCWRDRLRRRQASDGLPQPVSGPPIAECRELCPEACFDKFGVGGRQRVLGGQAPMGPAGGLLGGLKTVEFGDQALPQRRRLIGGQDGLRRAGRWLPAPGSPWRGRAVGESMAVRLLPIRPGRLMIGVGFGGCSKVRRIEVILPGNPDQGEQGIAPGIGQRRAHPVWRRGLARPGTPASRTRPIPPRNGRAPWSAE